MTYSICVRERSPDGGGVRFGVAAAARLPAVGSVCPHASAHGAVAVAGVADADLGDRCLSALASGRPVDDVIAARTDADASRRQIHGLDATTAGAHTGEACPATAGHRVTEACTVGGTSLVDETVLDALEGAYRENERDAPLPYRLLTALAAAEREGGDRRTDLPVGSAAVVVATPQARTPLYHDLRVDASESPIADLRETYHRAKRGYDAALERYGQTEN